MINPELSTSARQFNWGRFFFFGVVSLALCNLSSVSFGGGVGSFLSIFSIFSLFAPIPLTLAFLLYGRARGYLLGGICLMVLIPLFFLYREVSHMLPTFFTAFLYAIMLSEIVQRKMHPVHGFLLLGSGLALVAFLLVGIYWINHPESFGQIFNNYLDQFFKVEETTKLGQELLFTLQERAKEQKAFISRMAPSLIFVSILLVFWINLFVLLRNSHFWRRFVDYPFYVGDFIRFRVPDMMVYPLILSLALALGGKYIWGETGEQIGWNLLYIIGIFYFCQGLGVYLDLLSYLRIFRFLKMLILFFTIMLESRILFAIGVFDLWFDFRKHFKKKGDIS